MGDVLLIALMLGFFALATLFVAGCDRIIGPDEEAYTDAPSAAGDDLVEHPAA